MLAIAILCRARSPATAAFAHPRCLSQGRAGAGAVQARQHGRPSAL